jgi:carboxymethylenebutenolidase
MTAHLNGFSAAATPVAGNVIHTDTVGLVVGDVLLPVPDFSMPGYYARPKTHGPFPIVLVIQEIFGLHEYVKDVCRRFAKRGYLAIASQTFARAGDPSNETEFIEIREKYVLPTPDTQTMGDLDSVVQWAVDEQSGDAARLGIVGFCWGGRTVWLYSAHNNKLKAGVAWYGRLAGDVTENQPRWPVDIAKMLKAPVLGLYGGTDPAIPLDLVDKMNNWFKEGRSDSHIIVYPEAGHAFHADYRPSYRKDDAIDGEHRMFEWFEKWV